MSHDAAQLPLRERKKLRTRDALYEAAMELFDERPYAEVTVDDICDRAEVGRATFFRFFGAKAGLLLELNRRLADHARDAIADAQATSAADQLRIVATGIADTWAESRPGVRAMALEMLRSPDVTVGGETLHPELLTLVAEIVREGQRTRELRRRALTPEFLAWLVVTSLAGCVAAWFDHPKTDLHRAMREALDLLLDGLRASR